MSDESYTIKYYMKSSQIIKSKLFFVFHLSTFISILFFIFHLSSFISPVQAQQQTLRVSPVILNITLSPGKTYTQPVAIENLSDSPLPLRAAVSDFMTGGEEGGYVFAETKSNPLLSWIRLDETEFILEPKQKKEVQMTITTPKSIPVGGYYGILFFEPVSQSNQSSITQINAKVGVLMLANIGVPDPNAKKAEILTFAIDPLQPDGPAPFLLRVKSIALNFFSAKPTLEIRPMIPIGTTIKSYPLEEKTIFPGSIRRWEESNTITQLPPNIYKATIQVSSGQGQHVWAEKYFIVFPYLQALSILLLTSIGLILFFKRKRFGKAIEALIRP